MLLSPVASEEWGWNGGVGAGEDLRVARRTHMDVIPDLVVLGESTPLVLGGAISRRLQ